LNKQNEDFIQEKKLRQRKEDASIPPWVGYNEEEKMKEQILALSLVNQANYFKATTNIKFISNLGQPQLFKKSTERR
jgi:hypothetical protein